MVWGENSVAPLLVVTPKCVALVVVRRGSTTGRMFVVLLSLVRRRVVGKRVGDTTYICDRCGTEAMAGHTEGWRSLRFKFNDSLVDFESRLGSFREYCPNCIELVTLTLEKRCIV